MTKNLVILGMLILITYSFVREDRMAGVPGYDDTFNTSVYAGYLNTDDTSRKLHYVFVESVNGHSNTDPLILWLNGGPGCSSLLGFLQEIGPFYLEEGLNYTEGMILTRNPYSWHKVSNLLFLESPAGVGFSINTNSSFEYNDFSTLNDNFAALQDFFAKYPEYKNASFWIAGESYAGKYIPDLAFKIDHFNKQENVSASAKINLAGLLIGNGVMNFRDGSLRKSTVEYFINHDFIDPDTLEYWSRSCQHDEESVGCQFFLARFDETLEEVNPYNIYSECYYNDSVAAGNSEKRQFLSQLSILTKISKNNKFVEERQSNSKQSSKFNGAPCAFFNGLYSYFNTHHKEFYPANRTLEVKWNGPCAEEISENYIKSESGSLVELSYLFTRLKDINIVLYNGDWDGVVPYTDTLKNLELLKLIDSSTVLVPIIYEDQHIGFEMNIAGGYFIIIKGGSHQVPQSKRKESYYMIKRFIEKAKKEFIN